MPHPAPTTKLGILQAPAPAPAPASCQLAISRHPSRSASCTLPPHQPMKRARHACLWAAAFEANHGGKRAKPDRT